jgi:hypothetical protein
MKKQVIILLSFVFLFFVSESSILAQKTTSKKKSETEVKKKEAEEEFFKADERKRIEQLYNERMIDAATRRVELESIGKTWSGDFSNLSTGYAVAYPEGNYAIMGGSQDSETLEFRKSVKESSFTKDFKFNVEPESHKVSISVSGACKEGDIRIKILMPGGKTYTEVLLDEYGSVNWNKSFSIDEEDKSKTGEWSFNIVAKEATGNFKLSIRSY